MFTVLPKRKRPADVVYKGINGVASLAEREFLDQAARRLGVPRTDIVTEGALRYAEGVLGKRRPR